MVCYADMRATGFFSKQGFKHVPIRSKLHECLVGRLRVCTGAKLMYFENQFVDILKELEELEC